MEKYLRRCLDSLIVNEEGMKQLEVLVINDGSKDSSSQIAHEYQDKYPDTYRVIDKENGNYGSCINRGLKEATGKYVKVLDADDWYDSNEFLKLILYLIYDNTSDVDVLYTNFTYHNTYKEKNEYFKFKNIKYDYVYNSSNLNFKDENDFFMLKMYSVCFKTELLRNINLSLDTGISYTDNEYMYFPYRHLKKVVFLDLNIYQYFIGREGQTINAKITRKHLDNVLIIANRIVNDYISICNDIKSANIKSVLLRMTVLRCTAFFDQALSFEKSDYNTSNIRELYRMISFDRELKWNVMKKSRGLVLWLLTGLYKSDLKLF